PACAKPLHGLAEAGSDGGPMLMVDALLAAAWEGTDPPAGGRVVATDHRWDDAGASATDYDLACTHSHPTSALCPVGSGCGLITPEPWAGVRLLDDEFVVLVQDCEGVAGQFVDTATGTRAGAELGVVEVGRDGLVLWSGALPGV